MLPVLRSVAWIASSPLSEAAVEMKDSEEMKASEELEAPSNAVTLKQWLQLRVHEWHSRVHDGGTTSYW